MKKEELLNLKQQADNLWKRLDNGSWDDQCTEEFIALTRKSLPMLIAEIEKLRTIISRLAPYVEKMLQQVGRDDLAERLYWEMQNAIGESVPDKWRQTKSD